MKNNNKLLACPYVIWMVLFTIIPLGIVVYYALTDSITGQFTLSNLSGMGTYLPIFLRSIWLSLFASLICLIIGYPVAYFIAQCKPLTQRFLEMLIMLPMCMSFLLRTLAWVGMLEDTGIINTLLQHIGISPLPLIRTNGAVILGMVYNYLPYMILPLYTVIMKIDNRLVEAALDLGCRPSQVFSRVILPLSGPGILSGLTMVFVPAVSTFYISQKLGSTGTTPYGGRHPGNGRCDRVPVQDRLQPEPRRGHESGVDDLDLYLCRRYEPLRRGRWRGGHQGMKHFNRTVTVLVFIFLYIPMIVLAVASFNTGTDIASFKGFTFRQYANLFRDGTLLTLLRNSVIIALLATLISTIVGTMAAVGIHSMKGRLRSAVMTMTNIPMTNPDIVTGVALALLFAFAGTILKTNSVLGFWTLLIAHITFNLPYVILNVMPKLQQMDKDLVEAALDLGCTPFQSFTKVVIHEIMPGIISGALMAFTMSLDDFVISYFVTGSSFITLPVEIYNYTKKPIQPKIYALFTLMFIVILVLMVVMNLLQAKSEKNRQQPRRVRA